ncbi:conserved protein of unknown function [Nitrospira japonica]|uniref:Uncharacterized protein n=1 Tax=Nitrospira japonica TaxID=1325564 RepID=A0A1W1I120_9BACT|nr:DUF692 family multinuclear iron-containing protein [Nitrospira japonica]SLM46687.1 conserved protein of unknown function [Nitrospira japonica]
MILTHSPQSAFERRVDRIPSLGVGLSVDCYSPDLFALLDELEGCDLHPAYLELFQATTGMLEEVRRRLPAMPLAYHGEGLWVTQPDFPVSPYLKTRLEETVRQLNSIQSHWLNHECASKEMGGFAFGTYLPPLYTATSADVVADNIALVQRALDVHWETTPHGSPLFLLEMAPLTYFSAGDLAVPQFFRRVTDRVACGLVLDIGHLWTVYRYGSVGQHGPLDQFVERFLDEFPLERVVEIHVAGLAERDADVVSDAAAAHPAWIDAHEAEIPSVLWDLLEQTLAHPKLRHLRAVALEVDNKDVALIANEFRLADRRFHGQVASTMTRDPRRTRQDDGGSESVVRQSAVTQQERKGLEKQYVRYARTASGLLSPSGPEWQAVQEDGAGLARYTAGYLPNEILRWGGQLTDMFPDTCRLLAEAGIVLDEFVPWWFRDVRVASESYDFFLLKISRFQEFVCERAPQLSPLADREAALLRSAYADANERRSPAIETDGELTR